MSAARVFPNGASIWAAAALLAGMALLVIRYDDNRAEDFLYYYCAAQVLKTGKSPYNPKPYQSCVEESLARKNPHASRHAGSPYPPTAVFLLLPLASLSGAAAFRLWCLILILGGAAGAWALCRRPWIPREFEGYEALVVVLLLSWPGFVLGWGYHKVSLILFPLFLFGIRWTMEGRWLIGGLFLSALAIQPQWFCAALLLLALYRQWRALGCALGMAALPALPFVLGLYEPSLVGEWLSSVRVHSIYMLTFDNQGLFLALFKPFRNLVSRPTPLFHLLRWSVSLAVLAFACRRPGRRPVNEAVGLFLALILLAQPYSHASDTLWIFPFYLSTLASLGLLLRGGLLYMGLSALAGNLLLAVFFRGYAPNHLAKLSYQNLQGYLTVFWVAVGLLARLASENAAGKIIRPRAG